MIILSKVVLLDTQHIVFKMFSNIYEYIVEVIAMMIGIQDNKYKLILLFIYTGVDTFNTYSRMIT